MVTVANRAAVGVVIARILYGATPGEIGTGRIKEKATGFMNPLLPFLFC